MRRVCSMPDTRKHRGPGPKDQIWFGTDARASLRAAVADLSWLLSRGLHRAVRLESCWRPIPARGTAASSRPPLSLLGCRLGQPALARTRSPLDPRTAAADRWLQLDLDVGISTGRWGCARGPRWLLPGHGEH